MTTINGAMSIPVTAATTGKGRTPGGCQWALRIPAILPQHP